MRAPKPPSEAGLIVPPTKQEIELAATQAFRARGGLIRAKELEKNERMRDITIECAEQMLVLVRTESKPDESRISAAKGVADLGKSLMSIQTNTLKIADNDTADDVPRPTQMLPPPPPTMINAPGATFNMQPSPTNGT